MDLGIEGRSALVLAGGGGLGGAIASTLAKEGTAVVVADVNLEAATAVVDAINATGGKAKAMQLDLGNVAGLHDKAAEANRFFGPIDILVNNTGGPPPGSASGQPIEDWKRFFDMMVLSVISLTDAFIPSMQERAWGRIITSTSSGVISPIPNLGMSNSLRIALVGWSKTLAREVGGNGITSNIVVPGRIATARTAFLDTQKANREGREAAHVTAESSASIPLKRYGTAEEYANVVTFLASMSASYINGSIVRVDGGLIPSI